MYYRNTTFTADPDKLLDTTLALARDPSRWPVLVHCHACMDRTPAWMGIYEFVERGKPLDEVLRSIERHRGLRPKASVLLMYARQLPRLAPDRFAADPTAPLLMRCAAPALAAYGRRTEAVR
jgi:protein tyrosine/serine phosphatase